MSERRVVITGTGLITALADSRQALHEALCNGRRGLKRVQLFSDPLLDGRPIAGEITGFDPSFYLGEQNFRPLDRTSQLLISAAQLALNDSRWTPEELEIETVGLVVGTTFCSLRTISAFDRRALVEGPSCASPLDFANTVINAAAGQTGIWHKLRGVNSTISTGITSALEALTYAAGLIRDGHENAILAGGVEDLCVESLLAFQRAGLLLDGSKDDDCFPVPFDKLSNAFALAEGAALLMLEERDSALARGSVILAELKGGGSYFDSAQACRPTDQPLRSQTSRSIGIATAIAGALEESQIGVADVETFSLGANGNCFCDSVEALGYEQIFKHCSPSKPGTAIKAMLGENMGASAAIQTIEAISTLTDGRISGVPGYTDNGHNRPFVSISSTSRKVESRNCLVSSVGLDGHCCALIIGAPT